MGDNESSYPALEYIWSNAVRVARATHSNLQDEIEYIEDNLGGGGNISCNCSELEYKIDKNSTSIYYNSVNITSNANNIANLSDIKLSRDGSQPMTGLLTCQEGLKTNTIDTVSEDIITCEKDVIVNSNLWGSSTLTIGSGGGFTEAYPHIKFMYNDLILLTPGESGPLERIYIYGGWDDGEIMIKNADLAPLTDNRWDLGFPQHTWRCVYAAKGNFSGTIIPDSIITLENKIDNFGSFSVIVYKDGTKIYAKDASGNIIAEGDAGTDDRDVIQAAIDGLPDTGGKVVLAKGTYYITQSINLRSSVSFSGQGASTVLYVPDHTNPAYLPVIKMSQCFYTSVSDIKIDGNRDNQDSGREGGFHINGGSHCKIVNTWICNIYGAEGNGIYVDGTPSDFLIEGNTIDNIQDDGLDINGMVKSQIIGNNIHNCGDNGIDTEGAEYVTFSGNVIHECEGNGLELEQEEVTPPLTRYCAVTGNTIFDCEKDGLHIRSGGYNTISGNTIRNCSRYGIRLDKAGSSGARAEYNVIVGNLIFDCGSYGIYEAPDGADFNFLNGNYLKGNYGSDEIINGLHSQSRNDFWGDDYHYPQIERKIRLYKNYHYYDIPAHSIVIKDKHSYRPYAVDTTPRKGDALVLGVAIEDIKSDDKGFVLIEGKTKVRVNGSNDIHIGDFLGTHTERGVACKAESGDMGIAIALEEYTEDNSSGLIDVLVCTPRKIGSPNISCNCSSLEYKIENLSTIKLSRDGSQSMTGLLKCESGLETDSISSYSGSIVECNDDFKANGDIIGDSNDGLILKAEDLSAPAIISLTPGSVGKIIMGTGTPQSVSLPRIEIPGGAGIVDITIDYANLLPYIDNDQDLGSLDHRWKNIYAVSGNFSGTIVPDAILTNSANISSLDARVDYLEAFLGEMKYVEGGYTIIIYKDNGTIYAKEADGGVIAQMEAGIHDESVIQSAIDALPAEGGRVILREGTFILNSPIYIQRDNVIFEGQGWISILKVADNREESDYGALKLYGEESDHIQNLILRNFQVDGNRDNQDEGSYQYTPHVVGVKWVDYFLCENLYVHHSMGDGIETSGSYHWFIKNHVSNCREHEIHLNGVDYAWVINNYLHDDDASVLCLHKGCAKHVIIMGNILENAGDGFSLLMIAEDCSRRDDILIEGNILRNAGGYGIELGTNFSHVRIINNNFYSFNTYTIRVPTGTDGTIIQGNHVENAARGFLIEAEKCIIANNHLHEVRDYPIRIKGSQNIVYGNTLQSCGGYNGHPPVTVLGSYNAFTNNVIGPLYIGNTDAINVTGDYHTIRFNDLSQATKKSIVVGGTHTIVKDNRGFNTDSFKATSQSVQVGTSDSYGPATNITSPSGMISSLDICKIIVGGTFSTGEHVSVKVETNWDSGNTASVEKTYTSTGAYYLDLNGQDGLDLWRDSDTCISTKIYAKSDKSSTSVTVACDLAGAG